MLDQWLFLQRLLSSLQEQVSAPPQVAASLTVLTLFLLHPQVTETAYTDTAMLDELGWGVLPWLHRPHNFVRALAHVAVGGQHGGWTRRVAKYPEAAASVEQQTAFLRQHVDSVRLHERVAGVFLKETPLAQLSLSSLLDGGPSLPDRVEQTVVEYFALIASKDGVGVDDVVVSGGRYVPSANAQGGHMAVSPIVSGGTVGGGDAEVEDEVRQKKIDVELLDDAPVRAMAPSQSVIVLASLLDKGSNIGGLARTCEVFRMSKLVVADKRKLEADKLFKTMSVTADKWLPIAQVRPGQLDEFVRGVRARGYSLVALEQTRGSVPLQQAKLPKRMVLVLGNERLGLPHEVLSAVDMCIEIPQLGMIRSLNVHVSASIVLWEYTKQHALQE
mmetsp:Transcript_9819/g.23019  ORF Transcript_9819/g.23019 Transcript_9819/m.23019 type:complete len:388 (-) Transcript_9819:19-1182(-)